MNPDIRKIAKWARSQHWTVADDASGYTHFYDPAGEHISRYPATPSNPRRRMEELIGNLRKAGLEWPPPSKSEQRSRRRKGE